jgi:hypothetical protein
MQLEAVEIFSPVFKIRLNGVKAVFGLVFVKTLQGIADPIKDISVKARAVTALVMFDDVSEICVYLLESEHRLVGHVLFHWASCKKNSHRQGECPTGRAGPRLGGRYPGSTEA